MPVHHVDDSATALHAACVSVVVCHKLFASHCLVMMQPTASEAWRDIPELKQMRKKSFRKYLRNLKTEEEKEAARTERAKQTAKKHQLISDFVASRKKKKKAGNAGNAIKKLTEGTLAVLDC